VLVEDGRVALIERHRAGQLYYLFPGGGVESGETASAAAIREAWEELGVRVELGEILFDEEFGDTRFVYFAARIVGGQFGTGAWPDHAGRSEQARELSGSHTPVWLALAELEGLDVRPRELVALLRARYSERGAPAPSHDGLNEP
jgi:8-oxo-dGTP pyrophosphatase MutT (NUDIX family)